MAQGRRQAREPGGAPRAVGRHGGGGRPRRGARGFATLGRGAARVGGAGPAVGGGDAAAEARRGARADAQGRGSVLRGDRRATGLDLYKGKSLQLRRAGAASCGCTRSSRREPSASASRRSSRRWRPGRCRARRCSSSGRTSATARRAERQYASSTRRGCGGQRRGCRWVLWWSRHGRGSSGSAGRGRRRPSTFDRWSRPRRSTRRSGVSTRAKRRSSPSRRRWRRRRGECRPCGSTCAAGSRSRSSGSRAPTWR